jgi:hypothetical protein
MVDVEPSRHPWQWHPDRAEKPRCDVRDVDEVPLLQAVGERCGLPP